MNSKLKPCPFCGEQPKVVEDISVSWVACDNAYCTVYARTLLAKTREEAIEAWNTRAKDIDVSAKEHTCHMQVRKRGMFYDVFYFDCCGKEYAENRNDRHASKISGDVCPYCGAEVTG